MNIIDYTLDYSYHYKSVVVTTTTKDGKQSTSVVSEGDMHPPVENNNQIQWLISPAANIIIDILSNVSARIELSPNFNRILIGYSF